MSIDTRVSRLERALAAEPARRPQVWRYDAGGNLDLDALRESLGLPPAAAETPPCPIEARIRAALEDRNDRD